jgi:dihydrofolate synthase/folylpolyglutamate synthase
LTLDDWLAKILSQHAKTIDLGLERVLAVGRRMGFPEAEGGLQVAPVSIVVGGTNGKGSTCALLESILLQSGYRVATYTSPHLLKFNERLRINGEIIDDAPLSEAFARVESARGEITLTFFEFTTLAIFDLIRRASIDVAVLEIGLGGRLDAVNVVAHDCAVLVSVDMDHQDFLGDTREKIGWEKAHIARPGRPFILADPIPPASVLEVTENIGADVWQFGRDYNFQGDRQQWSWAGRGQRRNAMAYPALRGANQLLNASAVLAALAALRDEIPVTQGAVRQGFAFVELPGRFQVLPGQPSVVLDVAHNPHAAAVLAANLDQMGFFPKTIAIVGMVSGKDAQEVFRRIGDRVDHWCLASLDGPETNGRPRPAESLAEALKEALPQAAFTCYSDPASALGAAREMVEPNDRIVAFGSFLTVSHILSMRYAR